jgi:predicted amidohydrolase
MSPIAAAGPPVVAAVRACPVLLNRDATVERVVLLAEEAAGNGAPLVAFPEAFIHGYPAWVCHARPWDGSATTLYGHLLDQVRSRRRRGRQLVALTAVGGVRT